MNPFVTSVLAGSAADLAAGIMGADATRDANRRNEALQREFAQYGIRWKVEDAKAAGLHPLAALGANTMSFTPSQVGDTALPTSISNMGQNISRAINATRTSDERAMSHLTIEHAQLENELLRSQIANNNAMRNPPFPGSEDFVPGQGDSGSAGFGSSRGLTVPGRFAQEAGLRPDVSYGRTDTGLTPVIPNSLSESYEDDFIGKLLWRVRNNLMPSFGMGSPPANKLPKGYDRWEWNTVSQEWQPRRGSNVPGWMRRSLDQHRSYGNERKRFLGRYTGN